MSVSLLIKIPPGASINTSENQDSLDKKVMEKYPLMEIYAGEIKFKGITKCDYYIDDSRKELIVNSNSRFYDYVVYTICAFADVLGVTVIHDPQDAKDYPRNRYQQIVEDLPLELEIDRKQPFYPVVYRLYPIGEEKFKLTQIMQAVDKINEKSKNLRFELSDDGYGLIAFFDKEKKTETLAINYEYRYIEAKVTATKEEFDKFFKKIFKELASNLPAELKK